MKRIATVMLSIAISIVLLDGCTTVSSSDKLAMESLCRMILAKPDTLLSMSSDTSIWFVNPNNAKYRDEDISDMKKTIHYVQTWFANDFVLDTTYTFNKIYPYNAGSKILSIERKVYHLEFKSNKADTVQNRPESRYVSFQFFYVNGSWRLAYLGRYSLKQLQEKFRFPWYEDSIDVE